MQLNLDTAAPFELEGKTFHLLGDIQNKINDADTGKLKLKFKKQSQIEIDGLWATLGWADNSEARFKGKIEFSKEGTQKSEGATLHLIRDIYNINPKLNNEEFKVTERYINFTKVKFKWNKEKFALSEIPKLRLTIFLKEDEGAMVCYQHADENNYDDAEAEFEFLQPQKTDELYSTSRDRLNFIFPVLPQNELTDEDDNLLSLTPRKRKTSFIIKIFTYKRSTGTADELYQEALDTIYRKGDGNVAYHLLGRKKYGLLNYDRANYEFYPQEHYPIDFSKRTLLLIHGTFTNVWGSYPELFDRNEADGKPLLNRLLEAGKFEQIVAFNYPTISHDAQQNANEFYRLMNGNKFTKPVSVIGTSRGALLAKYLTADGKDYFKADKVIMFSGANGVGYFTLGEYISKFLSVMRRISGPGGKAAFALLQFSADYFLAQPGSQLMTPGHEKLEDLLNMKPNDAQTEYYNIVSDWNNTLNKQLTGKIFGSGLDVIIKLILGMKHDWVVGCNSQQLYFNTQGNYRMPREIVSMHAKYFDRSYTQLHNTHELIFDYL